MFVNKNRGTEFEHNYEPVEYGEGDDIEEKFRDFVRN